MKLVLPTEVSGELVDVPFEQKIILNRTSESQLQWLHGGKVLREGPVFNDWYGYMTSLEQAREEAKAQNVILWRICDLVFGSSN